MQFYGALGVLWRLFGPGYQVKHLHDLVVLVVPGRSASGQLVNGAAETPNVGKPIVASLLYNFRCHPEGSAAERLDGVPFAFADFLRRPEVSQLESHALGAIVAQEDVGRLDVAMDH